MILQGHARGGAKDLAVHLLKDQNDHVTVHELRGFVSDNLLPAFNEIYAVSRGTKAKSFCSLSVLTHQRQKTSVLQFLKKQLPVLNVSWAWKSSPAPLYFTKKMVAVTAM